MASPLTSTEVYLEHYRLTTWAGGAPVEIGRNGPAITYRASDQKTGAPVALTIVPIQSVDPAEIDHFEEKARQSMLLDHMNIAKTIAFGRTDESFVFVSEYPAGETVETWVKANGPMPPDAVVRIGLQVVTALGAASFHELTHPAIQPGNLVIVPGKTTEGGWPFVKLTHFALAGLKSAPGSPEPDLGASEFASPEQLLQDRLDFRSEIFSLGATMCFLLTGVFYSAYPRSPQTRRFARPLRTLIAKTLEDDPDLRPQDPASLTGELRNCLATIDRRIGWQHRFGIPFSPVARPPRLPRFRRRKPRPLVAPIAAAIAEPEPEPDAAEVTPVPVPVRRRRFRYGWAIVAALFFVGICGALLLPEDVVMSAFHRKKTPETIGVPIGVPDNAASPIASQIAAAPKASASTAPSSASVVAAAPVQSPSSGTVVQSASPAASTQPAIARRDSGPALVTESGHGETPPPGTDNTPGVASHSSQQPDGSQSDHSRSDSQLASAATGNNNDQTKPGASPAVVASNAAKTEPPSPAEAPENVTSQSAKNGDRVQEPNENDQAGAAADSSNRSTSSDSAGDSELAKSHARKPAVTSQSRSATTHSRVPRALPAGPDEYAGRRTGSRNVRARVIGVTPAGNVILQLPNGERAIVSPQDADSYSRPDGYPRRPRRVIIERRVYPPPEYAAPYQPFVPPGDD